MQYVARQRVIDFAVSTKTKHPKDFCSCQLIEQRLGVLEVGGVEAFGEPAVDRREQVAGLGALALIAPQASEAGRGAQLQGFRLLAAGGVDRPLEPGCCFGTLAGLGQDYAASRCSSA